MHIYLYVYIDHNVCSACLCHANTYIYNNIYNMSGPPLNAILSTYTFNWTMTIYTKETGL